MAGRVVYDPSQDTPPSSGNKDEPWVSMDFLQILIHQHAKTLVAIQDLSREVEDLKEFKTRVLERDEGGKGVFCSPSPVSVQKQLADSGFSTETRSPDEDPLYSLLELLESKVVRMSGTGPRDWRRDLGKLDSILALANSHPVAMDRDKVRAILREGNPLELQRQLLYALAKVEFLSHTDPPEPSPLDLAAELARKDIELEGTKARLRILEKSSIVADPPTVINSSSLSSPSAVILSGPPSVPRALPRRLKNPRAEPEGTAGPSGPPECDKRRVSCGETPIVVTSSRQRPSRSGSPEESKSEGRSPRSSLSSNKSFIPIAISRLKKADEATQQQQRGGGTGRQGRLWYQWFN